MGNIEVVVIKREEICKSPIAVEIIYRIFIYIYIYI